MFNTVSKEQAIADKPGTIYIDQIFFHIDLAEPDNGFCEICNEKIESLDGHYKSRIHRLHKEFQSAFPILNTSQRTFLIENKVIIKGELMECTVCSSQAHSLEHIMPHLQCRKHKKNLIWSMVDVGNVAAHPLVVSSPPQTVSSFTVNNTDTTADSVLCRICLARDMTRVLLPCRHAGLCAECYSSLDPAVCPFCRRVIEEYFEVYPC
jgi:hypothetical protein